MLGKLLKYDLKKNMRWLWILLVCTFVAAFISKGCNELGKNVAFFKIVAIFFDSVFYALIANTIIQPFLRSFLNFTKSLYGDESYLTHTLPVTKNQIISSKFLTVLIETILGFACAVASILIKFASPTMFSTLKMFLSLLIVGEFSLFAVITLFIILVIVEFLMFVSIIFFSIVLGYKSNEKKVLKSFLFTVLFAFVALAVLSVVMLVVLKINNINISSSQIILTNTAFMSVVITGIAVYSAVIVVFYFLTKMLFKKGVNVD